ncbi:MAG: BLUF domain-containing protein [Pirellulaceae bacterium]
MHLVVYTSEFNGSAQEAQDTLRTILARAKPSNEALGITGVVFLHGRRFLQFLEGHESDLRRLLSKIESDSRHQNMTYLIDEPVRRRSFPDWSMGMLELPHHVEIELVDLHAILDAYRNTFFTQGDMLMEIFKGCLEEDFSNASRS